MQVDGPVEKRDEKRRTIMLREVEAISFSFKNILRIDNLTGLDKLVKLQLDNNIIDKISNLGHLVRTREAAPAQSLFFYLSWSPHAPPTSERHTTPLALALAHLSFLKFTVPKTKTLQKQTNLTWLDLSFNNIAKIEGLETLTKLQDLSLYNNRIESIEGLDSLVNLNMLSLGNNLIKDLTNVMYLRRFKELRLINLAGNPISSEVDYKAYVISHLKNLTYLDYRRIYPAEVQQAREQFQDEVTELEEQERTEAEAESERQGKDQRLGLMRQANLDGVETLMEDMVSGNEDFKKLSEVTGSYTSQYGSSQATAGGSHFSLIAEPINTFRERYKELSEAFVEGMLKEHERKKAEHAEFQGVLDGLKADRDGRAKALVEEYERKKKHMLRDLRSAPATLEVKVYELTVGLEGLHEALLEIEVGLLEVLNDLCAEFDRYYTELADQAKNQLSAFFTQVRELEQQFFETVSRTSMDLLEKANTEPPLLDLESINEEARRLITDKDSIMNAVQACHDANTGKIDALEDRLTQTELRRANDLVAGYQQWSYERNRSRVAEIWSLFERHSSEISELSHSKGK
jgi:hypothetical protein